VDKAESEPEAAFAVNAAAPGLLAEGAKRAGAQIGAPTSAAALAVATAELLWRHGAAALGDARGIYHVAAAGCTSWHGFATEIARLEQPDFPVRIVPIASGEYPSPARRPRNSRLSSEKLHRRFGIELPRWEACLEACHVRLKQSAQIDAGTSMGDNGLHR
jgi:dTDP-4-dehydrorhamnose reductase